MQCCGCGFTGLVLLAGLLACIWYMRPAPWMGMIVLGLAGILFSAFLYGLAWFSPEGAIDPYKNPDRLPVVLIAWVAFPLSCAAGLTGIIATLRHSRRRREAGGRDGAAPRLPNAEALRPWSESKQQASRDVQHRGGMDSDITS